MSGAVIKEGYLVKSPPLTKTVASWKRRYFKLFESGRLDYYEAQRDSMAKGLVNLLDCSAIELVGRFNGRNHCLRLVTPQRTFILQCRDQADMRHWHEKIRSTRDLAAGETAQNTTTTDNAFRSNSSPASPIGHSTLFPPKTLRKQTKSSPQLSQDDDTLDQQWQRPKSADMSSKLSDSSLGTLTTQSLPYQNVTSEQRSGLTPPTSRYTGSYSPQPAKRTPYTPGEGDNVFSRDAVRPSDVRNVHSSTISAMEFSYASDLGRPAVQQQSFPGNVRGPRFMSDTNVGSTWSPTSSCLQATTGNNADGSPASSHVTLTRTDSAGYVPMAPQINTNGISDDYEYGIHYSPSRMTGQDNEFEPAEFEVPADYQRFEPVLPRPGIKSSLGRPHSTSFPPEVPSRQKRQVPTLPLHQSRITDGSGYRDTPPSTRAELQARNVHQFA